MVLNTIQISLLTLVALLGIPSGFLISKYANEELIPGRKWFKVLIALSLLTSAASILFFL